MPGLEKPSFVSPRGQGATRPAFDRCAGEMPKVAQQMRAISRLNVPDAKGPRVVNQASASDQAEEGARGEFVWAVVVGQWLQGWVGIDLLRTLMDTSHYARARFERMIDANSNDRSPMKPSLQALCRITGSSLRDALDLFLDNVPHADLALTDAEQRGFLKLLETPEMKRSMMQIVQAGMLVPEVSVYRVQDDKGIVDLLIRARERELFKQNPAIAQDVATLCRTRSLTIGEQPETYAPTYDVSVCDEQDIGSKYKAGTLKGGFVLSMGVEQEEIAFDSSASTPLLGELRSDRTLLKWLTTRVISPERPLFASDLDMLRQVAW